MADVSAKCGQFTLNTATGSQAISGVGFQPKAIMVMVNDMTADGLGNDAGMGFGYATAANQFSASHHSLHAVVEGSDARHGWWPAFFSLVSSATTKLRVSLTSMDSDGFTINVDVTDGVARKVQFVAFGGADLSAYVGVNTSPTATGTQAVSGFGFQPEVIIGNQSRSSSATGGTMNRGAFNLGFADALSQFLIAVESDDGGFSADNRRQVADDKILRMVSTTGAIEMDAALQSLDVDGATFNWTSVLTTGYHYGYLGMRGGEWKTGRFTANTATGAQAITGLGQRPKFVLIFSRGSVHDTASYTHLNAMIGMADDTSEHAIWMGEVDNSISSDTEQSLNSTKLISAREQGTGNVRWEADLQSLDADGFTLSWTTVQGSGEEFYYMAFGDIDVVAPSLVPRLTTMGAG